MSEAIPTPEDIAAELESISDEPDYLEPVDEAPPSEPEPAAAAAGVQLVDGLRAAALQGDAQAWQSAWQALDSAVLAPALAQLQSQGALRLTLCSEHAAHTYEAVPMAWHQRIVRRFQKTTTRAALQALLNP